MKRIAIITSATGGLGTAFIRAINTWDSIDEISFVGAFSKWTKLISKVLPTRIQMKWWMEATKRYL